VLLAQATLRTLEVAFELSEVSGWSQTPPVQLGSHQSHPIVAVAYVGLQQLELVAH
jgi:hypothetical protein